MRRVMGLVLATACLLPATAAAQDNVLVVIGDDMGVFEVGAYAPAIAGPTPFLDSLAANGVRFDHAWSNPSCSPTRATVMAGRYALRTGVGIAFTTTHASTTGELLSSEEALAELFTPADRPTGLFGKWHLGKNDPTWGINSPFGVGGFDKYSGSIEGVLTDYRSWTRWEDGVQLAPDEQTYATTKNVDDAVAWITAQTQPWFAVLAFNAPHTPLHVPPLNLLSRATRNALRSAPGRPINSARRCNASDPNKRLCYQAMIEAMDRELARLFTDASIGLDDTNVIFLGDNGTDEDVANLSTFPSGHYKETVFEGGIRVPLIVAGPSVVSPGRAVAAPVNTTDVFATVADITGATPTAGIDRDSVSLVPYLDNTATGSLRTFAYAETFQSTASPPLLDPHTPLGAAAYTDGTYKIIEEQGVLAHCYRLATNPLETDDLLDVVAHPVRDPACDALYDALHPGGVHELPPAP